MKIKYLFHILLLFFFPFVLALYLFWPLHSNEFVLIHDQLPFLSNVAINKYLNVWSLNNGGNSNLLNYVFFARTALVYKVMLGAGMSIKWAQTAFFALCMSITLILGYLGFRKIEEVNLMDSDDGKFSYLRIYLITFLYTFNPFTIIWMNSGGFWSLNFVLSYGAMPLLVFYIYKFLQIGVPTKLDSLTFSLLLFLLFQNVSFGVMASVSFLCIFIINFFIKPVDFIKKIFNWNTFIFLILFFILISDVIFAFTKELVQNTNFKVSNTVNSSTSFSQQGGILNIFLGYYTWSIYTSWVPRSILLFNDLLTHFVKWISLSIFIGLSYIGSTTKKINRFIVYTLTLLIIALFFAKGPQYPLGTIFIYLLNKSSIFGAVRSPDNKFSAFIVLSLFILIQHFLTTIQNRSKIKYISMVVSMMLLFVFISPLITRDAILGKNKYMVSGSFVASIKKFDYERVLENLNINDNTLIFPAGQFNTYLIGNNELFIGQDILPYFGAGSFIYYDDLIHMNSIFYNSLVPFYAKGEVKNLKNNGITSVLIRKNVLGYDDYKKTSEKIMNTLSYVGYSKVSESHNYVLYKRLESSSLKIKQPHKEVQNYANFLLIATSFLAFVILIYLAIKELRSKFTQT